MNAQLRDNKNAIRQFMRQHYTDATLIQLLQDARSGKLAFQSCCCLVGRVTADHETRGLVEGINATTTPHYLMATHLPGGYEAETAYRALSDSDDVYEVDDIQRRRRLIPMILAEIRRRQRVKEQEPAFVLANFRDSQISA